MIQQKILFITKVKKMFFSLSFKLRCFCPFLIKQFLEIAVCEYTIHVTVPLIFEGILRPCFQYLLHHQSLHRFSPFELRYCSPIVSGVVWGSDGSLAVQGPDGPLRCIGIRWFPLGAGVR